MTPSKSIEFRLKEAIESERFELVPELLAEYSAHVASMDLPPQEQIMGFLDWAQRTLAASRAHSSDQFQTLSDSRNYSDPAPNRKSWQITF